MCAHSVAQTWSHHFLAAAKVGMRISASRVEPSSTQRKLDVKKLRSQRAAESFSAQLSDKLRQPQSSPDDIGGLWLNISHSLCALAEAVVGFKGLPKQNQWNDEECRAASAEKNERMPLWRTTGREEGKRNAYQTQEEEAGTA